MSAASSPGKPSLSPDALVRTALAIADTEGLDALSMRRVGSELGVAAMSLYNHVANKDELLALMVDHVFGTIPAIDRGAPWDAAVTYFFTDLHDALLLHPAAAQVAILQPTRGEHAQRHSRAVIAVLQSALAPGTAVEAFIACSCFTLGAVLYTSARAGDAATDPGWIDLGIDADDEPALREHLAARAGHEQFRSGLEHLVRGYATEASGTSPPHAAN